MMLKLVEKLPSYMRPNCDMHSQGYHKKDKPSLACFSLMSFMAVSSESQEIQSGFPCWVLSTTAGRHTDT